MGVVLLCTTPRAHAQQETLNDPNLEQLLSEIEHIASQTQKFDSLVRAADSILTELLETQVSTTYKKQKTKDWSCKKKLLLTSILTGSTMLITLLIWYLIQRLELSDDDFEDMSDVTNLRELTGSNAAFPPLIVGYDPNLPSDKQIRKKIGRKWREEKLKRRFGKLKPEGLIRFLQKHNLFKRTDISSIQTYYSQ